MYSVSTRLNNSPAVRAYILMIYRTCAHHFRLSRFLLPAFLVLMTHPLSVRSQVLKPSGYRFQNSGGTLLSNNISDILAVGDDVWFGTGRGVSMTPDNGVTFTNFYGSEGMGKGGVSALAYNDGVIWVATGFDTVISDEHLDAGGGLSWSDDNGAVWHHIPQPVDPNNPDSLGYKPTTTHVQNITYDIAFHGGAIWIASWGGGLRKSTDNGASWTVVTPDGFPFEPLTYNNHLPFSIVSTDSTLWVGTAQGINKSTDGGETWTNYNAQNGSGISGNFVTAMGMQPAGGGAIIWAATWKAEGEDEYYAVSRTTNGGLTWNTTLDGEFVHNFGFNGDEVYAVSDNGIFKSPDRGEHWNVFPYISDQSGEHIYSSAYYAVAYAGGILWAGSSDGLAQSTDGGMSWTIIRSFITPGSGGEPAVYAYPNPFSPLRHNRIGGEGHVRFQYTVTHPTSVTLTIYDFGMNTVAEIVKDRPRLAPGSYAEVWNGTNRWGRTVANGVYFYRLEKEGDGVFWGKIIVLN